jgi:MFS family permease
MRPRRPLGTSPRPPVPDGRQAPSSERATAPEDRSYAAPVARLWLAVLLGYVALGATLQVLPAFTERRFHAGPLLVGVVIGLPSLAAATLRPLAGLVADSGRARASVLVAGALGVVGGLGHLWSPDLLELLLARLVLGASEGAMFVAAVTWVLRAGEPNRRGRIAGWFGLSMWGGLTLGPTLSFVVEDLGGVSGVWICVVALPALGLVLTLSTRSGTAGHAAREHAPPRLLPREARRPGMVLGLASYGYGTVAGLLLLRLEHSHLGLRGVALSLFAMAFLVTRVFGSSLGDRYGGGRVAAASSLVEALGLGLVAIATDGVVAVAGIILSGAGVALIYPAVVSIAVRRGTGEGNGAAVGSMTSFWDIAIALAAPVGGLISRGFGYPVAFGVSAAVVAAAAVLLSAPGGGGYASGAIATTGPTNLSSTKAV